MTSSNTTRDNGNVAEKEDVEDAFINAKSSKIDCSLLKLGGGLSSSETQEEEEDSHPSSTTVDTAAATTAAAAVVKEEEEEEAKKKQKNEAEDDVVVDDDDDGVGVVEVLPFTENLAGANANANEDDDHDDDEDDDDYDYKDVVAETNPHRHGSCASPNNSMLGIDIASIVNETGPVVKCVLLKASLPEGVVDVEGPETIERGTTTTGTASEDTGTSNEKDGNGGRPVDESKDVDVKIDSAVANAGDDDDEGQNQLPRHGPGTNISEKLHLVSEIEIDTTPKRAMVQDVLGGPVTFLGQYEDEGTMVIVRRPPEDDDSYEEGEGHETMLLPENPHTLQPPLHDEGTVRGDILIMRVAPGKDEGDNDDDEGSTTMADQSNGCDATEEIDNNSGGSSGSFFLDYTRDEYIKFASRRDLIPPLSRPLVDSADLDDDDDSNDSDSSDDDESSSSSCDEDDEDEEDIDGLGMMNFLMGHMLRKFREEHGRGPDTDQLLEMRCALAEQMGIELPPPPPPSSSTGIASASATARVAAPSNAKANVDDNGTLLQCSDADTVAEGVNEIVSKSNKRGRDGDKKRDGGSSSSRECKRRRKSSKRVKFIQDEKLEI